MMKNKILITIAMIVILAASIVVLTGCENKSNPLVGKWEYSTGLFWYEFNNDMTGSYNIGSTKMDFTYTDNGTSVTITYTGNSTPMELNYRFEDNKLIITDSFGSDVVYNKK